MVNNLNLNFLQPSTKKVDRKIDEVEQFLLKIRDFVIRIQTYANMHLPRGDAMEVSSSFEHRDGRSNQSLLEEIIAKRDLIATEFEFIKDLSCKASVWSVVESLEYLDEVKLTGMPETNLEQLKRWKPDLSKKLIKYLMDEGLDLAEVEPEEPSLVEKVRENLRFLDRRAVRVTYAVDVASLRRSLMARQRYTHVEIAEKNLGSKSSMKCFKMFETEDSVKDLNLTKSKLNAESCQKLAAALRKNKGIKSVDLRQNQLTILAAGEIFEALRVNTTLSTLCIRQNPLATAGIAKLADLMAENTTIKVLDLQDVRIRDPECLDVGSMFNDTLEQIELRDNRIEDAGVAELFACLETNKSLKGIGLRDNRIADEGCFGIHEGLRLNTSLEEIDLQDNRIADLGCLPLAALLKENSGLKKLNLRDNRITITGITHILDALTMNHTLQTLDISDNRLNEHGIAFCLNALGRIPALKALILAYRCENMSRIKDEDIEEFSRNTSLEKLDLSKCRITNSMFRLFMHHQNLRHFIIKWSKCGALEGSHLAKLVTASPCLEVLDLENNLLPASFANALAKALKSSNTIKEINLRNNKIDTKGATNLYKNLKFSNSLKKLILTNNKISAKLMSDFVKYSVAHGIQIDV